jgi:hypothetical protein
MWQRRAQSRRRCGSGAARSRRRCGSGAAETVHARTRRSSCGFGLCAGSVKLTALRGRHRPKSRRTMLSQPTRRPRLAPSASPFRPFSHACSATLACVPAQALTETETGRIRAAVRQRVRPRAAALRGREPARQHPALSPPWRGEGRRPHPRRRSSSGQSEPPAARAASFARGGSAGVHTRWGFRGSAVESRRRPILRRT